MKLVIQIPCYNEEEALPAALADLPRELEGVDVVEWLIVNDGSSDRTVAVAKAHGVDHIVDLPVNMGLAHGFMAGLARAVAEGADIIVNTDADNQYDASSIPDLIRPILERRAEFVIGDRPIRTIAHFSWTKRMLQRMGSAVVKRVSGTAIGDAPSGFRALTRDAAMRINIFDGYTYTLESIIQAGRSNIRITSVPVGVNGETRPSRLVRSIPNYVMRSTASILRTYFIYQPLSAFFALSLPALLLGLWLIGRWTWLTYAVPDGRVHLPSLVAAAILLLVSALLWIGGLIGELLKINRRLLEDIQYAQRRAQRRLVEPHASPSDA
ncbi:glycosyltransferase family 2 protein [Novosphingopyxis sp.]|uniref:glycosyltransferase family 2 protein n=1 Tax=Novosphingopyxis sp. TaxID=2709690 RepID=UPI003B5A4EA4